MDCVYFVMSGVVEILKTATADDAERETSAGASLEHSFTVDIDESLMLDCSMPLGAEGAYPMGAVNGRLHIDRMKVSLVRLVYNATLSSHLAGSWCHIIVWLGPQWARCFDEADYGEVTLAYDTCDRHRHAVRHVHCMVK